MRKNKYGEITEINSGKTYTSINEVCNTLKVNRNRLYKLFREVDINKPYLIEIDGFKFSKAMNIDTTLAYKKTSNVQIVKDEEGTLAQPAKEVVEMYSGKTFSSIRKCCEYYGISINVAYKKLSKTGVYEDEDKTLFLCLKDCITVEITDLVNKRIKEKENEYEILTSNNGSVFILKEDQIVKKCVSAKDLLESVKIKEVII